MVSTACLMMAMAGSTYIVMWGLKSTVVWIVGAGIDSSNCKQTSSTSLRDDSRSESGVVFGCGNAGCASTIRWYRDAVALAVVSAASAAAGMVMEVVVGVKSKVGSVSAKNASR